MITWGLGIEHEFKLKFENLKKIGDYNYNFYLDSLLVNKLNKWNEINFYQQHKKNNSNIQFNKEYSKRIELLIQLRKKGVQKDKYPFDKINYFNIKEINIDQKNIYFIDENTLEYLNFYLEYLYLFHYPLLFYDYINDKNEYIYNKKNLEVLYFNSKKECIEYYFRFIKNVHNGEDNHLFEKNVLTIIQNKQLVYKTSYIEVIKLKFNPSQNNKNINYSDQLKNTIKYKTNKINDFILNNIKFPKDDEFIKTIFFLYKHKIPHKDYSSKDYLLEMKTIDYKNINYEKSLNNLIHYEKSFMKYMNIIFSYFGITQKYGLINYDTIGSRQESIELTDVFNPDYVENTVILDNYDYTGSFHVWVTCPYHKDLSKTKFLNIHTNLANKLQLLEPLIACNFSSPSFDIKYNKNHPSKMSYRHFVNAYSNYGSSDVSLINGSNYSHIDHLFLKYEKNPTIYNVDLNQKKVYNKNGTLIKNFNRLAYRKGTNNVFSFLQNKKHLNSNNVKIKSFYEILFKTKHKGFKEALKKWYSDKTKKYEDIDFGADIRTGDNQQMMYPLDTEHFEKIYMPKNNDYELYFINQEGNIFDKRIYNVEKYKKKLEDGRMGIEFRIFDHFPTQYMNQFLGLLPYLVIESLDDYPIENIKDTYISKQFWHNEMANVIMKGYKHQFSENYIKKINHEFKLDIEYTKNKLSSDQLFEKIYEEFMKKYKGKSKNKQLLNKLTFDSPIQFISINEYATQLILDSN